MDRLEQELAALRIQQAATGKILKVISQSGFDLTDALTQLIRVAIDLCDATRGVIWLKRDDRLHLGAHVGYAAAWLEAAEATPPAILADAPTTSGLAAFTGERVHVVDILSDPRFRNYAVHAKGNYRAGLAVPLKRDGAVLGVIALSRPEARGYDEHQIALVETFAEQAVIAIDNTRLLAEVEARTQDLTQSLKQQTATADVLKVISRSAFDLDSVLQTLIESANSLCEANASAIYMLDGDVYRIAAAVGASPEFLAYEKEHPNRLGRDSFVGRTALEKKAIHVPDAYADAEHASPEAHDRGGYQSALCVPLLREGVVIGVFALSRKAVGPYTPRQIELAESFADQAVIAIQNVRLFREVEARTRDLAASLQELRTAQDRLVQTEKLASLGQLTAGIAHEIKNPLNFVNNFASLSAELIDELSEELEDAPLDERKREAVAELSEMLKGNLAKVVQHGKRADSIVKNMLLHSRTGSSEHRPSDVNAIVEEALNLAYHGARAERQDFNITLERAFDPAAGEVDLYPQEMTRVLLNLITNGFHATAKRKAEAGANYEPKLVAATRSLGDRVEIRIRDNGSGIPPHVREKMFNPFFTTKPAGEGTGLGLSLSHDIVVKQHGGRIDVETEVGAFAEFRITLPRRASVSTRAGE